MTQSELLKRAEQCKRLASGLSDDAAREILERLGREYEAEAALQERLRRRYH